MLSEIPIPTLPWYVYLGGLFLLYVVADTIHEERLRRKLGASRFTNQVRDPTYGFLTAIGVSIRRLRSKNLLADMMKSFEAMRKPEVLTFRTRMLGKSTVMTKDPENIKAVLATQFHEFNIGNRHGILSPLLGEGIFTSSGEHWKHSRAMLRPQFAREQVADTPMFERHTKLFIKHLRASKGEKIDINDLLFRFTIDVATEFIFGESVHQLYDDKIGIPPLDSLLTNGAAFNRDFRECQDMLSRRSMFQGLYWMFDSPSFRSKCAALHRFADHFVKVALDATPEEIEKKTANSYIFLYELVKVTRDPKLLRDQLFNLLLAGRNTTSLFLTFFFFEVSRRPDLFEKIKEEVRGLYGEKEDARIEEITFESLKKTRYLKAALDETLRLYPLVSTNFRAAVKNTTIPHGGGKDGQEPVLVRKGDVVIFSTYGNHRNKCFWGEDADEYRPERWFEEKFKRVGWNYMPFLGGPRICLGQQMALTEAAYLVTRVFQEFDHLESCNPVYPPGLIVHTTIKPREGCFVKVY
ncbi:cytochrome P450 52A2 [Diutina catenulata]